MIAVFFILSMMKFLTEKCIITSAMTNMMNAKASTIAMKTIGSMRDAVFIRSAGRKFDETT